MFPFLSSGVEARRGVEFRHSTRNAPKFCEADLNTNKIKLTKYYTSKVIVCNKIEELKIKKAFISVCI